MGKKNKNRSGHRKQIMQAVPTAQPKLADPPRGAKQDVRKWALQQISGFLQVPMEQIGDETVMTPELLDWVGMAAVGHYGVVLQLNFDSTVTVGEFVSKVERKVAALGANEDRLVFRYPG